MFESLCDKKSSRVAASSPSTWDARHEEAVGVKPGRHTNINAGFFSLSFNKYAYIMHEWRNLMTRSKPFDLWYGDQGALNAILDKYEVRKTTVNRTLWNQTRENGAKAKAGTVIRRGPLLLHRPTGERIYAWHGTGWHKLWHQIGIDHYRNDAAERENFRQDCQGRSPAAVVRIYKEFLFMDRFNQPLTQADHLLKEG